jgi:hypothetical protein
MSCFTSKEIARHKGIISVEAITNVEINEINSKNLSPLDVSEIPDSLVSMASGPLLLSYKFLFPTYDLKLDIKKHQDVAVLVAIVEKAHFSVTFSPEGSELHRAVFQVRNTQKQYMRLTMPDKLKYDIWSIIVDNNPVKPALDESGRVMIPLSKASKNGNFFLVENLTCCSYDK